MDVVVVVVAVLVPYKCPMRQACAGRLVIYIGEEVNVSELLFTCYHLTNNLLAASNYLRSLMI